MPVRIHGGDARGRVLHTPRGIRPTAAQVVEAIFNVLGASVGGAVVLDLFSGSGALGIEALSRGAERVTFVERSEASASILRRNLQELDLTGRASVVRGDAARWVETHPADVADAAIVLLDPPYDGDSLDAALRALDRTAAAGARVVAEHRHGRALPGLERLAAGRTRRYGDTAVTFFQAAA